MQAYSAAQREGLAYLSIDAYKSGFVTAQLFFGTWLFPLGYPVYRFGSLPRWLGVLLIVDGIAVLIWFGQALLLQPVSLAKSDGYNPREIARIRRLVEAHGAEVRERWRDFFSD